MIGGGTAMEDAQVWVGLDLGLRQTHICVIDAGGATVHEADCETSPLALQEALSPFALDRIGLIGVEAGSDTHVVRKLRVAGYPVVMFEARKASRFLAVRRNKTDASDAKGLADLARIGRNTISQVYLKSLACEQLRGTLVMRKRVVVMRVVAESVLRSRLSLHGRVLRRARGASGVRPQVEAILAQINAEDGVDLRPELGPLLDLCDSLSAYLKKLNSEIEARAKCSDVCRLLMEIPGVGPVCAVSFYTAIEDPSRFVRTSDVAAYLGLVPRRYQSGEVSRTLGITKNGSKLTRAHLVTAATVFGRYGPDCALKEWYAALRERIGSKRARVALARKLAIVLLTMWKNNVHFEAYPTTRLPDVSLAS
jgi:transposase